MPLGLGLGLIGFGAGASSGGGSPLLDGSESDGTNLLSGNAGMTSGWSSYAGSLTNAATTAPNGLMEASKLVESATSNVQGVLGVASFTADSVLRFSCYSKPAERTHLVLSLQQSSGTPATALVYFDLTSGIFEGESLNEGVQSATNKTIAAAGGGFNKYSVDIRLAADNTSVYVAIYPLDSYPPVLMNFPSYAGNGSSGIYLWRPKLVQL